MRKVGRKASIVTRYQAMPVYFKHGLVMNRVFRGQIMPTWEMTNVSMNEGNSCLPFCLHHLAILNEALPTLGPYMNLLH
jgi:hypothetical protein